MGEHLSRRASLKVLSAVGFASATTGSVSLSPETRYEGHHPDAPWRSEAHARIERIRTAPLTVVVRDRAGNPVPDAKVSVEMTGHAFGFGTAVSVPAIVTTREGTNRYRQAVRRYFNRATIENGLKWSAWSGYWGKEYEPARTIEAIRWLRSHELPVRGHTLVWPSFDYAPPHIEEIGRDEPDQLRTEIDRHIREKGGRLAGLISEWDVINEPTQNTAFMEILSRDVLLEWLHSAREVAPTADLFINDYAPLQPPESGLLDRFIDLIEYVTEGGAPLDGIGIEAHFTDDWVRPPTEVLATFDRLSEFGRELQITEYSLGVGRETETAREFQADYTRDLLVAAFSHPAVTAFTFWGFWAERHWRPSAALFGTDWNLRPHGRAFLDLVYDRWWTDEEGTTDDAGSMVTRGFKGSYLVRVDTDRSRAVTTTQLSGDGTTVEITLD